MRQQAEVERVAIEEAGKGLRDQCRDAEMTTSLPGSQSFAPRRSSMGLSRHGPLESCTMARSTLQVTSSPGVTSTAVSLAYGIIATEQEEANCPATSE